MTGVVPDNIETCVICIALFRILQEFHQFTDILVKHFIRIDKQEPFSAAFAQTKIPRCGKVSGPFKWINLVCVFLGNFYCAVGGTGIHNNQFTTDVIRNAF